jgi:hypothetical protein
MFAAISTSRSAPAQLLAVPWVLILLVTRRSRDVVLRWWLVRGL